MAALTDDPGPGADASATGASDPTSIDQPVPETLAAAGADTALTEPAVDGTAASLLELVDRLAGVLDRSDLVELEVAAGGTSLVLRKPSDIAATAAAAAAAAPAAAGVEGGSASAITAATDDTAAPARPSVKAPLTGIFYASPAPGSPPYVRVDGEVAAGQVIGLIEAMKLFNEIKSDLAGRVVRVVAESGQLVKAKQPLIEVEPL